MVSSRTSMLYVMFNVSWSHFSYHFNTNTHFIQQNLDFKFFYFYIFKRWISSPNISRFVNEFRSIWITFFHFDWWLYLYIYIFFSVGIFIIFNDVKSLWKEDIILIWFYITYGDLAIFRYLCLFRGYCLFRNRLPF